MARRGRSFLWVIATTLFGIASLGFYLILVPDNAITQAFRQPISNTNGRVIVGPYPVRADFRELRNNGVKAIVSLLDPNIPYERILLERERENAQKYGLKFFNFPMASILGQRLGDYYTTDAALAAHTIDSLVGEKVYLHCYLGVHRTNVVRTMLEQSGTATGTYRIRQPERNAKDRITDSAFLSFKAQDYKAAISYVNRIVEPEDPALLLRGWSLYRVGEIPAAKRDFYRVLNGKTDVLDATNGLAYCFLREGKLDSARTNFQNVLAQDRANAQARRGLGIIEFRNGNFPTAREHLAFTVKADSSDVEARELLLKVDNALTR